MANEMWKLVQVDEQMSGLFLRYDVRRPAGAHEGCWSSYGPWVVAGAQPGLTQTTLSRSVLLVKTRHMINTPVASSTTVVS